MKFNLIKIITLKYRLFIFYFFYFNANKIYSYNFKIINHNYLNLFELVNFYKFN